ncbi:MAG: TetR/AcrR family transcriptional regulator [Candidatus Obscuribacterales bacterium]|nr:TetR/AcrR family transcriptional regulator [Candidatus Obscuribacterales bacterium]
MSKGSLTREMILSKAAALFNSRGYFGASLSDVMQATGLEKGGIYNHFESKDALALEAFDYAVAVNGQALKERVDSVSGAIEKLQAVLGHFKQVADKPLVEGGCPLLNSAIESDDAHPLLCQRVQKAMARFIKLIEKIIEEGIASGTVRHDVKASTAATFIIASLEGGVMLSKLYQDKEKMLFVIEQMQDYIAGLAARKGVSK